MLDRLPDPVLLQLLKYVDYNSLLFLIGLLPKAAEMVRRARHLFTGNPVYRVRCMTSGGFVFVKVLAKRCCGRPNCKAIRTYRLRYDTIAAFLYGITPKHFEFEDSTAFEGLKQAWWDRIKCISCISQGNNVNRWIGRLRNCGAMTLAHDELINAKTWLAAMRSVERFTFYSLEGKGLQMDDDAIAILTEKSKIGRGIMKLSVQCNPEFRLSVAKLAEFFSEAKFGRPALSIGILLVKGKYEDLQTLLAEKDVRFYNLTTPFYVVERPESVILVKLTFEL